MKYILKTMWEQWSHTSIVKIVDVHRCKKWNWFDIWKLIKLWQYTNILNKYRYIYQFTVYRYWFNFIPIYNKYFVLLMLLFQLNYFIIEKKYLNTYWIFFSIFSTPLNNTDTIITRLNKKHFISLNLNRRNFRSLAFIKILIDT